MMHSVVQCDDPTHHHTHHHNHHNHNHNDGKRHSHHAHTHAHNHKKGHRLHRNSIHVPPSRCDSTSCHSQCEAATTDYDLTETATEAESWLNPSTSTASRIHAHRNVGHSLHVSVNLRFSGTNSVLLSEDVFIPVAGSETLNSIFEAALHRHPSLVGRYILRKEKDVVILCHDEEKSTYARTSLVFAALSRLRPIRLIYCVVPNVEVIRELDSQKDYTLKMNARTDSDPECILEKDAVVEAQGNVTAVQLWTKLTKTLPQFRGLASIGVLTRRPDDNVVVRFGMHDFVADLVNSRGRRFVFILTDHHGAHPHAEGNGRKQNRHLSNVNPDCKLRFKPWYRFRRDSYEHGKRKFQWGLLQKE